MVRVSTVLTILAYLVALIGYLPVFVHAALLPRLAFPLAFIAGCLFDRRKRYPLAGIPSTALTVIAFLLYGAQFSKANPAAPVVNFLLVLLAVRLLNEKSPRNLLQIFALALFSLAGSSLFSLSAVFLVYLVLLLTLIAVSLVLLTFHTTDDRLRLPKAVLKQVVLASLAMPAASLPLLIVFFAILPRTQYPLLNFLNTTGERVTGLSDRITPGAAARVGEIKTVALRVECERLGSQELYWRGIVLDTIQGTTWTRGPRHDQERVVVGKGREVRQVIYPEPSRNSALVALNVPVRLDGVRSRQELGMTFTRTDGGTRRIRYEARSVLSDTLTVRGGIDRDHYLQLPARLSERTVALGRQLAGTGLSDAEILQRVTAHFASQRYAYATSDLAVGGDPVDSFLFERRRGHCEFFASSFAILLRLAGVPARLVGGYYGGEYHDLGGYYLITEDRAHAWVEAFVAGKGWVTVDPTIYAAGFDREGGQQRTGVVRSLNSVADSLTYYWNQAVISYDLDKQLALVQRANVSFRTLDRSLPSRGILSLVGCLLLTGAAVVLWRTYGRVGREERILKKFLVRVDKVYGTARRGHSEGLHEFARRTGDQAAMTFADVYGAALFRDRPLTVDEARRLNELIRQIGAGKTLRNP